VSHEADFYQARGASVFQAMGSTVGWTWEMADLDRYMGYAIVPKRANAQVTIDRITITSNNDKWPGAEFVVTVAPFDRGDSRGICHLTFHAVRIPPQ
jgi:hypothetical protein